jgi:hypothetical protein
LKVDTAGLSIEIGIGIAIADFFEITIAIVFFTSSNQEQLSKPQVF